MGGVPVCRVKQEQPPKPAPNPKPVPCQASPPPHFQANRGENQKMGRHDASDVRPDGLVVNKDLKFAEKNQFGDKYRNYEDSARQVASVAFTAPSPLLTYQCHATRVSFRKTTASPTRSSLWTSQSSSHIPAFPFAMHAREACAGLTWRMVGPESSSCVRNGCTNHLPCIRRAMSNPDTGLLLPGSTILERMANSRAWRSALPTRAQYGAQF